VPYPFAADDHQAKNAEYYVRGGGAVQFREQDLDASRLAETVLQMAGDPARRAAMGAAMRKLAFPGAANAIVDVCLQVIGRVKADGCCLKG
jgi:UDP-N-acetylglucosamine--N-acetylmuramyl-(pentapeptide) pyrophosphoryl-undecaprenol N-acetylglucosamine transferase